MFKFTIREIVLATLVVAIGLGWLLDRTALDYQLSNVRSREWEWNELVKVIEARGGKVVVGKGVEFYMEPGGWTDSGQVGH